MALKFCPFGFVGGSVASSASNVLEGFFKVLMGLLQDAWRLLALA